MDSLYFLLHLLSIFLFPLHSYIITSFFCLSLLQILPDQEDRKLFGAMIVIAANAGGAWTPIGKGRMEGSKGGRKDGGKQGRKEGWREVKEETTKKGRKEGRKEGGRGEQEARKK
jgi:hypothetical protein